MLSDLGALKQDTDQDIQVANKTETMQESPLNLEPKQRESHYCTEDEVVFYVFNKDDGEWNPTGSTIPAGTKIGEHHVTIEQCKSEDMEFEGATVTGKKGICFFDDLGNLLE